MSATLFRPERIAPDPRASGTLGFFRALVRDPVSAVPEEAYETRLLRTTRGSKDLAFVTDPDVLAEVLIKRVDDFPKTPVDERVFVPALGQSLLTARGEDWRWKRRLAAPWFTPAALKPAVPRMVAPFATLAENWRGSNAPRPVEVWDAMTSATLEVIDRTLFEDAGGRDPEVLSGAINDFLNPISWTIALASLNLPAWMPHPGRGRWRQGRQAMRDWTAAAVRTRRAAGGGDDLCGTLMAAADPETGRSLSDDDLVDMLLTLVAAGHETSANSLTFAIYCLAQQPEAQDALRAEVAEVAGDAPVASEDLPRLVRTEAFINETLRLFPAGPIMSRMTTRPETFCGEDLPVGCTLFLPIYVLHRHRTLWRDPDTFDPERFIGLKPPRTQFMPFGAGPRVCVGGTLAMMEMVAGLATLVRAVRFTPNAGTVCEPIQRVTLRPKKGLSVDVSPV